MKKLFYLIFFLSFNTWAGFDDICLIPNLDLTTIKMELSEKGCEKNDILYVMSEKQTDLPFIMAITSAFQADDAGSIPAARSINLGECNGKNKPSY